MQSDGGDMSRTCQTEKASIVASVSSSSAQRTSLIKDNDKVKSQGRDKIKEKKVVAGDKAGDKVGDKRGAGGAGGKAGRGKGGLGGGKPAKKAKKSEPSKFYVDEILEKSTMNRR
jgi:hypothetical protein